MKNGEAARSAMKQARARVIRTPAATRRRYARALACGAAAPFVLAIACATPALAASAAPGWRAIVLKGAAMPQLIGADENHLEVLAIHKGRAAPIPFQVDEVLPDGRYALPEGPEPLLDDSPGILDRDDEVAMMLSDLGDRAGKHDTLPVGALAIEALDSLSGARRWAYIAAVPAPRRSPVSYVRYQPAESRIDTASYRMTFRGDFPVALALKDDRGEPAPSLIDASEVRVTARVLMIFKLRLSGRGVTNRVLAWHAGPIRLIRRVSHSVKLVFGIRSPQVVSGESFYRDYAEDSFVARVRWVPRVFFGDARVRTWLNFVGIGGFTLSWPGMEAAPLRIGAGDSATLDAIQRDPPYAQWLALKGGGKIVIQTFMPSPDLDVIRPRLFYHCGGAAAPEASAVCTGPTQIGYLMTGWENLSAGTHRLKSTLLVVPGSADPHRLARELAAEPVVTVAPATPH